MTENSRITLIVDGQRFLVDKKRIIEKSRYFSSLYSHNFSDSKANEHTIRYKFAPSVVQDFCDWIEEDPPRTPEEESHQIKISLQKYLSDSFQYLKQFVELSIIYSVDELSGELSDVIIQHWLKPVHLLDIWRLSRELSLTALTDVSFASCLERFTELPVDELFGLPDTDFLKLVSNVNVKSSINHLISVLDKKLERYSNAGEENNTNSRTKLQRLKELLNSPERKPHVMHCFFTEVLRSAINREHVSRVVQYFHPQGKFGELVEVWKSNETQKDLAGMGVIGRGFSVYKIGGEHRLGSCKFNMNVWRYCLISKQWYYLARLRKTRRHMAIAIVGDKLVLIGGVGRYRLKLTSVEVLDLHTGCWTDAPDIADTFTDVPPCCVMQDIIVLCVSNIYMFNVSKNAWICVLHDIDLTEFCNIKCLTSFENTLFIGKEGGMFIGYEVTWKYDNEEVNIVGAHIKRSTYKYFKSPCDKIFIDEDARVAGIVYAFEKVTIEYGKLEMGPSDSTINSRLHSFSLPIANLAAINSFNLTDPSTLYKQIIDVEA